MPRQFANRDEIGDLFRSFRTFRANALRLDRSNSQLHQRNALLENVFNNMSDGVAVTDDNGRIRYFNGVFCNLLSANSDDYIGRSIEDVFTNSCPQFSFELQFTFKFQGVMELKGREKQILNLRVNPLPDDGRLWLLTDITEGRELEDRLNQIRRIEALGKIAGEVAHDFGNILSTVSTNLYLLEDARSATSSHQIRKRIANAIEIGTSLTQRLLAFSKKQQLVPEIVELNALVEGVVDLIGVALKSGVELNVKTFNAPIYLKVDPGQLESAVLNLCLNSIQAISGDGVIRIEIHVDEDMATITVADNGVGMDEATLTHSMEPFFTARSDNEGTGLGLSMVYGFIKQTGGDIKIASQLGSGTSVKLFLPIRP